MENLMCLKKKLYLLESIMNCLNKFNSYLILKILKLLLDSSNIV